MTKKEKLLTLEALKSDAIERRDKASNDGIIQYEQGRINALNDAIAVLKNGEYGNEIKRIYLGKEN